MFEIRIDDRKVIHLTGRLDASQVKKAEKILEKVTASSIVNFEHLDYISSAGLGMLLAAQKKLQDQGHKLTLIKMNNHLKDVFRWAGFDMIFEIE